jgi:hypothetical protein
MYSPQHQSTTTLLSHKIFNFTSNNLVATQIGTTKSYYSTTFLDIFKIFYDFYEFRKKTDVWVKQPGATYGPTSWPVGKGWQWHQCLGKF